MGWRNACHLIYFPKHDDKHKKLEIKSCIVLKLIYNIKPCFENLKNHKIGF